MSRPLEAEPTPLSHVQRLGDGDGMKSVLGKVQLILEAFTAEDDSVSLTELVRRTGIAKATVYRLLQELLKWGVLERSGSDYQLGIRLFEMGQRVPRLRILRETALPYMEDLLLATQETIHFAVVDGLEVLYLEKLIMHRGLKQQSRVAGRLPLYCTATGRVILAFSPRQLLAEVLRGGLVPVTRHTVRGPSALISQIEQVRGNQVAVEFEEIRLGYGSVAVPVFGAGSTLAGAISITAPTVRVDVERFKAVLQVAARGISRRLRALP
jgi:DNA-binding IclR family transcriptional regulator